MRRARAANPMEYDAVEVLSSSESEVAEMSDEYDCGEDEGIEYESGSAVSGECEDDGDGDVTKGGECAGRDQKSENVDALLR